MNRILLSFFLGILINSLAAQGGSTCGAAVSIGTGTYTASGPASGGGANNDCWFSSATNAEWYSFTPTTSGSYSIESDGTSDTRLSVFTGTCSSLSCLDSDDDDGPGLGSFLSLNCLEAGTTYYIQWDDIWDDVSFDFTITMLPSVVDQTGGSTCQFSIDDPNFVDNGAICSDFTFPASTGSTDAEDIDPDIDYGCLGTTPNPAWYYIEMSSDGDFEFEITADPAVDVDYAIWGPFSDLNAAISSCNWGTPIVCDYSTNPGGSGSIPCAMTGNVYLVLITNYSSDPTDISMNQTGGTAVPDCSIVMPVIIKSFNAVNKGNYNEVTWESSSEFNSHLYVLEKKVKDQWISINEVESKNRPYGANYSIKDPDVLKENYYRLKMIDYDGSTEYSTVIYVRGYVHDNLVLFPNPVMEKINFSIEGTEIYGDIEIKIFNSTGELVKNLKMSLDSERNTIDSKDLKNGVYYIEITSSLDTWKTKFVKN